MSNEEIRTVMLYMRLGVIRMFKNKLHGDAFGGPGRELLDSMTDADLDSVAMFFCLGAYAYFVPASTTLVRLKASGLDLAREIRKEVEDG